VIEEPDSVARARMVSDQIRARGVDDPRVIDAMLRVPRHLFVGPEQRPAAYEDHPIAIGFGQTISQPYIVGFMLAALKLEPTHRVLEIGTGSGYQTALLAELVESVYSLDVVQELADGARRLLDSLGYRNVIVRVADGHAGWPEHAPYDRIVGAAAPEGIPPALVEQLTDGGIIALPVGVSNQELVVSRRHDDRLETLATMPVRFVPMVKRPQSR
jgi:protein-L-isoaspartate(D-aspartate) O-methyltransferase